MSELAFSGRLRNMLILSAVEKAWLLLIASVFLMLRFPGHQMAQLRQMIPYNHSDIYTFLVFSGLIPLALANEARRGLRGTAEYRAWTARAERNDRERKVRRAVVVVVGFTAVASLLVWWLAGGVNLVLHLEMTVLIMAWLTLALDIAVPHDLNVGTGTTAGDKRRGGPQGGAMKMRQADKTPPFP